MTIPVTHEIKTTLTKTLYLFFYPESLIALFCIVKDRISFCRYSPDGKLVLSCSWDKTTKIWDASTGRLLHTLHTDFVSRCDFSVDGQSLVVAACGAVLRVFGEECHETLAVWDVGTGKVRHALEGHLDRVSACCYSPDGLTILSCSWDRTLKLWDANTGRHKCTLHGHQDRVTTCTWSPDGRSFVSGSDDKTLKIWG
jgi:WD40 repeat protein